MFFATGHNDLPASAGVFPLDSVILLPRMQLTLNVFEPRYLNLVEDALHNRRLLTIVQPQNAAPDEYEDEYEHDSEPPLFSVGGLGRIVAFQEEGKRVLISLEGVTRVRLGDEHRTDRGYRIFSADYKEFSGDFIANKANFLKRDAVMPIIENYMKSIGVNLPMDNLAHISDERLIYSIAMLSNFDRAEKQALLECLDVAKQAEMLITLMTMALQGTPPQGSRGNTGDGHDIV